MECDALFFGGYVGTLLQFPTYILDSEDRTSVFV
jgi:hypothetical protein